jgi:hypothetical protein
MDNYTTEIKDAYKKTKENIKSGRVTSISSLTIDKQYKTSLEKISDIQYNYKNKKGVYGIYTNEEHRKTQLIKEIKNISDKFIFYVTPIIDDKYTLVLEEELLLNEKLEEVSQKRSDILSEMTTGAGVAFIKDGGLARILRGKIKEVN